jgi:hypothetical protein
MNGRSQKNMSTQDGQKRDVTIQGSPLVQSAHSLRRHGRRVADCSCCVWPSRPGALHTHLLHVVANVFQGFADDRPAVAVGVTDGGIDVSYSIVVGVANQRFAPSSLAKAFALMTRDSHSIRWSELSVRTKIAPSAMAHEARIGSDRSVEPSCRYSRLAAITVQTPCSLCR